MVSLCVTMSLGTVSSLKGLPPFEAGEEVGRHWQ